jgi:hypothetical protein
VISLAFRPLVPVSPDLGRVREVGTDFDEARTELEVEDVEVVGPDEFEPGLAAGLGAVLGAEDPVELLGHHDVSFAAKHRPERLQKLHRLALATNLARYGK